MKKLILVALSIIVWACCGNAVLSHERNTRSPYGIWTTDPEDDYPFVRGCWLNSKWKDIEPSQGQFDFRELEETIKLLHGKGMATSLMILVGPDSPDWLYEVGVPKVETSETFNTGGKSHKEKWPYYPYYLNPVYREAWFNQINRTADWVESLPVELRSTILLVQTAEGTTGDEGPYKGDPSDPQYDIPSNDPRWVDMKVEAWQIYKQRYGNMNPPLRLLINSGNRQQYESILDTLVADVWKKSGHPGHIYQYNGERTYFENLKDQLWSPLPNGEFRRFRSELDAEHNGWFQEAPAQNMYWLALSNLNYGLDILRMHKGIFEREEYLTGLNFFSKYAGQKDPATAIGAFCAMKDVLDVADTDRFPESVYGEATSTNRARFLAIAGEYKKFGARLGDIEHAMGSTNNNRRAQAINDVGFDLLPGNYEVFLNQIEPNATSRGWWNIGPAEQPYGRFARSFDTAAGKNTMYFTLNKCFFAGQDSRKIKARVVYLDQGKGQWSLCYVDKKGRVKKAKSVTNTGTGDWKEIAVIINDAAFSGNGPKGADLILTNDSGDDSVFHMIEVLRM